MSNPHWHTWALVKHTFYWLLNQGERHVISTHKTREAAERAARHLHKGTYSVRRSSRVSAEKLGESF